MLKNALRSIIIVTLFVVLIQTTSARGDEIYFIDAHSQVDHKVAPLEKVISLMKQGGVSHTILSARGKQITYWKKALAELPIQVAHLIAHGNAERLWHIASRQ